MECYSKLTKMLYKLHPTTSREERESYAPWFFEDFGAI